MKQYDPIDIHKEKAPLWPDFVPPLTAPEAIRAAKRLWRYSLGMTYVGKIHVGTGNRINWYGNGTLTVNPSRGWKAMVHELSHYFWRRANPGERPHSKHHARFETKLVKEVLKRGWLEGVLRDKAPVKEAHARAKKLALIEAGIERWEAKAKRARTALAKLAKKRTYYLKALGG